MGMRNVLAWLEEHFSEEITAIHELKSWPDPFQALMDGTKRAEVRAMDRDFAVGDLLYLREWNPVEEAYTGRHIFRQVTHITHPGEYNLPDGLGVLSVR